MRLKTLLAGMILLFTCIDLRAQEDVKTTVKAEAAKMLNAFKNRDYAILVSYTHPRIIELMGGPEQAPQAIRETLEGLKDIETVEVSVGEVLQLLDTGAELQTVIPQFLVMKMQGITYSSKNHLVGISEDKGKTWTFFDANGFGEDLIRELFPNLSKDLVIPPKESSVK